MFNAAGWRGVHALDAIAHGDGPNTFADLVTQEFQWSRSLVTVLLKYTPRYLGKLSPCGSNFSSCSHSSGTRSTRSPWRSAFLLPILALSFKITFVNVAYPSLPQSTSFQRRFVLVA